MFTRPDGRQPDQLRPVTFAPGYTDDAEGSVLVTRGGPHVLCNASVENRVPQWLTGKGQGWLTAEYSLLPRTRARGAHFGLVAKDDRQIYPPHKRQRDVQAHRRVLYLDGLAHVGPIVGMTGLDLIGSWRNKE